MKTPIQTTSRKCQNIDRHISRRWFSAIRPRWRDLGHQHDEPDDAEGDVQSVRSDEREEGGQEGAALRARALVDEVRELVELDAEKPAPSRPVTASQPASRRPVALHLEHREAVGDGRQQQQRGVHRDQRQVEQVGAGRARRVVAAEHAVRGEQASRRSGSRSSGRARSRAACRSARWCSSRVVEDRCRWRRAGRGSAWRCAWIRRPPPALRARRPRSRATSSAGMWKSRL